jgi:hypothetical protein
MPHTLYIEQLSDDGRIGRTANIAMMERNIETIQELYPIEPPPSTVAFPAGRFIAVLAENGEETFMMFFDLGKDSSASFDWASRFEDEETRDAFLIAFRQIADRYEDVENLVQLELSTAFPSNPAVF